MRRTELRRHKPFARGDAQLERRRIKPKRRTASEARDKFRREFHSEARRDFVAALPCCACGSRKGERDNHHVRTDGTSRRGPYTAIVPMCRKCHRRYHDAGKLSMLQRVTLRLPGGSGLRHTKDYFDSWDDCAAGVERLWLLSEEVA
jgi:hypothetical protein